MTRATQLFTAYGTIILIVGFSLGSVLGVVRMKSPSVRNLANAHVETLMQGAMHLGLGFAVSTVGWDTRWATIGAVLLVVGSPGLIITAIGILTNL